MTNQFFIILNATITFNTITWLVKVFYDNILIFITLRSWLSPLEIFEGIVSGVKKPLLSWKVWLKLRELNNYLSLLVWIYSVEKYEWAFKILMNRIRKQIRSLFRTKGANMHSFNYLKECLRLVIRFLAGQPEHGFVPNTLMVRKDRWGLPVIIPKILRIVLRIFALQILNKMRTVDYKEFNKITTCILSVLSIFRILPTKVPVKLSTIVAPFNGITKSLDESILLEALKELPIGLFKLSLPKLLLLETAGPNGFKSTWTSALDIIAIVQNPKFWMSYILYAFKIHRCYWLIVWMLCLSGVVLPFLLLKRLFNSFFIGRFSIVLDQAGKARVIAICSWWLQVLFKPLHDAIFKVLKAIPQDGTFDQEKPINLLINSQTRGNTFYSYDLSAATDRLPIDLQRDVLNLIVPNLGTLWYNILISISYMYDGELIKYAVGQPMGAYSSWGMLALTHHICVRAAALRVGISNFVDYAVLGDDITIANDAVAASYLELMRSLGVAINLSKSLTSTLFVEFAKRWIGPDLNLTPIAPGLILRTIRRRIFVARLLVEAIKLNILTNFSEALVLLTKLPGKYHGQFNNVLWAVCGISSSLLVGSHVDFGKITWCFSFHEKELLLFKYVLWRSLLTLRLERLNANKAMLSASMRFFIKEFWRHTTSDYMLIRWLENVLRLISPAYWTYLSVMLASYKDICLAINKNMFTSKDIDILLKEAILENAPLNVASIDWRDIKRIKETEIYAKRLRLILSTQVDLGYNTFVKDVGDTLPVKPLKEVLPGEKWDGSFF